MFFRSLIHDVYTFRRSYCPFIPYINIYNDKIHVWVMETILSKKGYSQFAYKTYVLIRTPRTYLASVPMHRTTTIPRLLSQLELCSAAKVRKQARSWLYQVAFCRPRVVIHPRDILLLVDSVIRPVQLHLTWANSQSEVNGQTT